MHDTRPSAIKKKTFCCILLCLTLLFSLVSLTGCGKTSDTDTLVYGSQEITAINPALYEHGEINALIFAELTAHDRENKVVPGLAKSWKWDESSLSYTFVLKKDLTFHDGTALTSADVKFTLEAILNPKYQSEIRSNYTDIDSISCPDRRTVRIKMKQKNVAMPDYLSIGILPRHLLKGKDLATCDFNQHPVGAGPYRVTKWEDGQSIRMEAFRDYYDGIPKIKHVLFKIVEDADARVMQLQSGELDVAQITPKAAKKLRKDPNYNIVQMKTADYRAISYNEANGFFKNHPELPNILSYGIDRKAIVKSVLLGEGQVAYSPLQKNQYCDSSMKKFNYQPDKCCALLRKSGWKKNKDGYYEKNGQELAFTIYAMENDAVRVDMAKMCAQQLQKVGVHATAAAKQEMDWEHQEAAIIGWGSPFDADDHTYKIFTSHGDDNYTGYANPVIDRLLTRARHTSDKKERKALYQQFQQAITKKMPYTFIAYLDADYAVKKGITGITKDTILGHHGVGIFWNIAKWTKK